MWSHRKVEQALFRWSKWRQSIILQWMNLQIDLEKMTPGEVRLMAREELAKLRLPESLWLELYWISSIDSAYNLNEERSFKNIIIPRWFPPCELDSLYGLSPGSRMHAPVLMNEKDVELLSCKLGVPEYLICVNLQSVPRKQYSREVFLPSTHELYSVIGTLRGRPKKKSGKRGRPSQLSDRLAVQCAAMKDQLGFTYVGIAGKLKLAVKHYWESEQSAAARHLTKRGRELIKELT